MGRGRGWSARLNAQNEENRNLLDSYVSGEIEAFAQQVLHLYAVLLGLRDTGNRKVWFAARNPIHLFKNQALQWGALSRWR